MKILEITSGRQINGATKHCLLLSMELAKRGHDVSVLARPDSWIEQQLRLQSTIEFERSSLKRMPGELARMARWIKHHGFDVIHTHMSSAHFFGVLMRFLTGVPVIATAHQRNLQLHWMFNNHVIGCSETTSQFQNRVNLVSKKKLQTIHNFIDVDKLGSVPKASGALIRKELGISDDAIVLGTVGDVVARKGLIHLIEALPKIIDADPNVVVLSVGPYSANRVNREYHRLVIDRAKALGVADRVICAGSRSDIPNLLQAMDLYILPSLEECFPLSILEAMSVGLPVIASDVGGIPECVENGHNGFLVPAKNIHDLANAVINLVGDPRKRQVMGALARQTVLDRFSPASQTEKTLEVFQKVISRNPRRTAPRLQKWAAHSD